MILPIKGTLVKSLPAALVALSLTAPAAMGQNVPSQLLTDLATQDSQGEQLVYEQSRDWFIKCASSDSGKKRRCELESPLSNDDTALAKAFSAQIILTGAKTPPLVIVRTPLDLHLSKGVELRVGKSLVGKLTYRSCHGSGCVVPFSMVGQVNRRFLRGSKASFTFFDLKGKAQRLELSLLGISKALRTARDFF